MQEKMAGSMNGEEKTEAFLRLLGENEKSLGIYITGLVACPQDAQDILQEARLVMWREFPQFQIGTNFASWARRILFFQVLSHRRRANRRSAQHLSERVLELLHEEAESAGTEQRWQQRQEALKSCLSKLSGEHREILEWRYREEFSIEHISRRTDRTEGAIYRLLSRLRKNLYHCVNKKLG